MRTKRMVIMGAVLACALHSPGAVSAADQAAQATGGDMSAAKSKAGGTGSNVAPARSRANEDARHCLKAGDNLAIIRCAEQYR